MPRGGYRPGAGGKTEGYEKNVEVVDFERERADHERVKKEQRQFKLDVEKGEYLPREDVQQAGAVVMATLCQALQSIVPNLERRANISSDVRAAVTEEIDAGLRAASASIKAMSADA